MCQGYKPTSTFLERSKVSVALLRYAVMAASISLAAKVSVSLEEEEEEAEEEGGSWRILRTWSLLVSTVLATDRKES